MIHTQFQLLKLKHVYGDRREIRRILPPGGRLDKLDSALPTRVPWARTEKEGKTINDYDYYDLQVLFYTDLPYVGPIFPPASSSINSI